MARETNCQGGAIAPPVAIANAIADALSPFGAEFQSLSVVSCELSLQNVRQSLQKTRRPARRARKRPKALYRLLTNRDSRYRVNPRQSA
jgi:hypothetical protein